MVSDYKAKNEVERSTYVTALTHCLQAHLTNMEQGIEIKAQQMGTDVTDPVLRKKLRLYNFLKERGFVKIEYITKGTRERTVYAKVTPAITGPIDIQHSKEIIEAIAPHVLDLYTSKEKGIRIQTSRLGSDYVDSSDLERLTGLEFLVFCNFAEVAGTETTGRNSYTVFTGNFQTKELTEELNNLGYGQPENPSVPKSGSIT